MIEGRVRDSDGRPVAGIGVRGVPHGADVPWSPRAVTGCDGTFRMTLFAPGSYGFQLFWGGISVMTASAQDPARLEVALSPGESRTGIDLVFLRAQWRALREWVAEPRPPCP